MTHGKKVRQRQINCSLSEKDKFFVDNSKNKAHHLLLAVDQVQRYRVIQTKPNIASADLTRNAENTISASLSDTKFTISVTMTT